MLNRETRSGSGFPYFSLNDIKAYQQLHKILKSNFLSTFEASYFYLLTICSGLLYNLTDGEILMQNPLPFVQDEKKAERNF
jgi:hypothetical protein